MGVSFSERAKRVCDDYEYVYRHYTAMGLEMHYTGAEADSVRGKADVSVLTAFRAPGTIKREQQGIPQIGKTAYPAGALAQPQHTAPADAIYASPGESLQKGARCRRRNEQHHHPRPRY